MTDYEDYCEWAGDGPMPRGAFARLRMRYPRSDFDTLHRWWQRTDKPAGPNATEHAWRGAADPRTVKQWTQNG